MNVADGKTTESRFKHDSQVYFHLLVLWEDVYCWNFYCLQKGNILTDN